MPRRYLFGPVSPAFAETNLHGPRRRGECLALIATIFLFASYQDILRLLGIRD